MAGLALSDCQQRLLPSNLELQLYLHVNKDYWEAEDDNEIIEQNV